MRKLLFLFLLSAPFIVFGQTVNLTPSQDNSIYSESNNSNGQGNLFSGRTGGGNLRRALLQFDLSSIPSNAIILGVELTVNVNQVSGSVSPSTYSLHRVTTAWGEGTSNGAGSGATAVAPDATWSDATLGTSTWTSPGGDFVAAASRTAAFDTSLGTKTFTSGVELRADVQNWVNGTNANNGWILIGDESTNNSSRRMGSKDSGIAPVLTITYSLPTTLNFTPSKDNSIFENATNNSNGSGTQLFSGNTCAASPRRAFMQFDLSSIPAGATITSVELTMNVNQISVSAPGTDNYTLHRVTTDWGEGTSNTGVGTGAAAVAPDATWLAAMSGTVNWTTPGGDFIAGPSATQSFPAATGSTTIASSAGLVADVQGWLDGTNPNFGWVLIGNETRNCSARRFGSRENAGNEPTLTISYSVPPATVNLTPSKDNSIFENATNNSNGQGVNLFSGNTCAASPRRAFMEFDLSSIPAGATITSVELTMNVNQISISAPGTDNYTLHRVTTDWGEGSSNTGVGTGAAAVAPDATWNDAMLGTSTWTTQGGDFVAGASTTHSFPSATGNVTIASSAGLVADVQGWLDGTNSNFGWVLIGNETRNCSARRFGSRENAGNEPTLTITYDTSLSTPDVSPVDTSSIIVYPNPSVTGIFNIRSSAEVSQVMVYDILGKQIEARVNTSIGNDTSSVDLSAFKSGIYFLKVSDNTGKSITKRVIRN